MSATEEPQERAYRHSLYSRPMILQFRREAGIAIVTLAQPPVNALSLALRTALVETFSSLSNDPGVKAVVLHGAGTGFCAGGDRSEFGTPAATQRPTLSRDVLQVVEKCGRPVVAAMHGYAVGGGLELALACDARVAAAGTRIGMPEIKIGVTPLSGTQRLPRLLGVEMAAEMMLDGTVLPVESPALAPMFEHVVSSGEELLAAAIDVARTAITRRPVPVRDRPFVDQDPRAALHVLLERHPLDEQDPPVRAILESVAAAVTSPTFDAGLERAQQIFDALGATRATSRTTQG
jgi:3-hydroxyacyl-CoA dehydrogenase